MPRTPCTSARLTDAQHSHSRHHSAAMATISVLYPAGANFNLDYYTAKHMPMVMDKWGQYGLKSW